MVEPEKIQNVAVDFVKAKKKVSRVNVISVELKDGVWVVRGMCPIDLEGHPWLEGFEIKLDQNGKIKYSNFYLI